MRYHVWEGARDARVKHVVVSEVGMQYSTEKQIKACDKRITCGSSTKSSNSPLGVFAFLRFWRGRRLSEQPAGPYVNRRIDLSPVWVSSLQQQTSLSVLAKDNITTDGANRGISDVSSRRQKKFTSIPSPKLPSNTLGSLRQRKAAPPTATAPAPNNSRPSHHLH